MDVAPSASLEELEDALSDRQGAAEASLSRLRDLLAEQREARSRWRRTTADAEAARQNYDAQLQLQHNRAEARTLAEIELSLRREALELVQQNLLSSTTKIHATRRLKDLERAASAAQLDLRTGQDREARLRARRADLQTLMELQARVNAGLAIAEIRVRLATGDGAAPMEAARASAAEMVIRLEARQGTLVSERNEARAALAAETDRLQALADLSSALRSHLTEHDTNCPVCDTTFAVGELLERARRVDLAASPTAELTARRAHERTQELGQVAGQLQLARTRLLEAEGAIERRRNDERELDANGEIFGGAWSDEAQESLEERLVDLRARLAIEEGQALAPLVDVLDDDIAERALATQRAETALETAILERDAALALTDGFQASARLVGEAAALEIEASRLALEIPRLQQDVQLSSRLEQDALLAVTSAAETLRSANETAEEDDVTLSRIDAEIEPIVGTSSPGSFVQEVRYVTDRIAAGLERIRTLRAEVEARRQAAMPDERLTLLRSQYAPGVDQVGSEALRRAIQAALNAANAEEVSLAGLGSRLSARARLIRQIDQRMHGTALAPWNSLFRSVYSSLAGSLGDTLEWTSDRVDMRTTGSDARPRPHVDGQALSGWMAGHYFSEGQLAALQISSMITASVLLPWSRWNTLLLDDPLQHADVIKVGAFADLVRSLSQDMGHQIFLTTHDQSQAGFIVDKFRAAGLPARIVHFQRPPPRASSGAVGPG